MAEYALVFRGRERGASPEDVQRTLGKWRTWFAGLAQDGHLKEPGHPLEDRRVLVSGRGKVVNDGPFIEAKDLIAGFIVITASGVSEAVELARGCPILEVDGSVEVCPIEAMG